MILVIRTVQNGLQCRYPGLYNRVLLQPVKLVNPVFQIILVNLGAEGFRHGNLELLPLGFIVPMHGSYLIIHGNRMAVQFAGLRVYRLALHVHTLVDRHAVTEEERFISQFIISRKQAFDFIQDTVVGRANTVPAGFRHIGFHLRISAQQHG